MLALITMAQEGEPRINTSSASQNWGQKRWSVVQSNVLGSSIGTDKHYRDIGQKRVQNILGESCYHRIKFTAANSLTALMWRWYLNSGYQPYSYYIGIMEGADGTSINTSHLACTWRTRMRGEGSIKGRGGNRKWRSKNQKRNTVTIENQTCN